MDHYDQLMAALCIVVPSLQDQTFASSETVISEVAKLADKDKRSEVTYSSFLQDNQRFRHQHAEDVKEIDRRKTQAIENRLRAEKAESAVTAAMRLHAGQKIQSVVGSHWCHTCSTTWPCRTAIALALEED